MFSDKVDNTIGTIGSFVGMFVLVASAGAFELNYIGFFQCIMQIIFGMLLMAVSTSLTERTEYDPENESVYSEYDEPEIDEWD